MPDPKETVRGALPAAMRRELHVVQFVAPHHRLVRTADLLATGLSEAAISRWVARGRLRRRYQGVYVYGNGELSQDGEMLAALWAIGEDSALACIAAAVHDGFWPYAVPSTVDVVVPRLVRSRAGIRVHSVDELPPSAITELRGIRMTTPARTVRDLGRVMKSDRGFRRVVHEAQVQKKLRFEDLVAEFERTPANFRGRRRLIVEIAAGPTPTRSGFEDWAVELLRNRGDFPRFVTCAHPPGTPAWVEVDIFFPDQRLVLEIDGDRYHKTPWRVEQDAYKRRILEGEYGYPVLVLTDEDAACEEQAVEKIWRAIEEAEAGAAHAANAAHAAGAAQAADAATSVRWSSCRAAGGR